MTHFQMWTTAGHNCVSCAKILKSINQNHNNNKKKNNKGKFKKHKIIEEKAFKKKRKTYGYGSKTPTPQLLTLL